MVVAGTAGSVHTLTLVVHVGAHFTPTAIHHGRVDLAGVVRLVQGIAGTTAVCHVVAVHRFLRAG